MMRSILALMMLWCVSAFAASPAYQNFNTNQFGTASYMVTIKSGAILTNPIISGTLTVTNAGAGYVEVLDGSGNAVITLNGTNSVITGNGSGVTNIQGNGFSFASIVPNSNGTNFVIDLAGPVYKRVTCTNDVWIQHATNSGSVSLVFDPNGATRAIYFPTNWHRLSTNGLALSNGTNYVFYASNGYYRAVLSLTDYGAGTAQQSNVVAGIVLSKPQ